MVNPDDLVHLVLGSVLGGRRKHSRRAHRYLKSHGSFWSRPSTLMTAAGVAWGIFETLQQQGGVGGDQQAQPAAPQSATSTPAAAPAPAAPAPSAAAPAPPTPAPADTSTAASAPIAAPPAAAPPPTPAHSDEAVRIVRLAISAAFADGVLSDAERAAVLQQAREAGVADIVEQELHARRPLREIVAGVTGQTQKITLYVLAFTILRADEQLSGAERIYLAQLANLLGLDAQEVQALEQDVGERIDALGDQGQFGG